MRTGGGFLFTGFSYQLPCVVRLMTQIDSDNANLEATTLVASMSALTAMLAKVILTIEGELH